MTSSNYVWHSSLHASMLRISFFELFSFTRKVCPSKWCKSKRNPTVTLQCFGLISITLARTFGLALTAFLQSFLKSRYKKDSKIYFNSAIIHRTRLWHLAQQVSVDAQLSGKLWRLPSTPIDNTFLKSSCYMNMVYGN